MDVTKRNRPPDGERRGSRGRKGNGREEAWIGRGRKNRAKRIIQQVSLAPLCRLPTSPLWKKRARRPDRRLSACDGLSTSSRSTEEVRRGMPYLTYGNYSRNIDPPVLNNRGRFLLLFAFLLVACSETSNLGKTWKSIHWSCEIWSVHNVQLESI